MTFIAELLPQELVGSMITTGVWQESCPVHYDQLRLVRVLHYDFAEQIKEGQLIVHQNIAANTIRIFQQLLDLKFPINKMIPIDQYSGDDEQSMADNNSSCFNYRKIAGSNKLSMHAYGLAIDINPLQNPYLRLDQINKSVSLQPKKGINFLNRANLRPGMVEQIVDIFKTNGLSIWGGDWNDPIDYHHFQINRSLVSQNLLR